MVITITVEKFNELRVLSVAICEAIKANQPTALGLAGDLVNELIDIEDHAIDSKNT
jgi:hypothetical protein